MIKRERLLFLLLLTIPLLGQQERNLRKFKETVLEQGGTILLIIVILSFVAFSIIFYVSFILRSELVIPLNLQRKITACLSTKDYSSLTRLCKRNNAILAKIFYGVGIELRSDMKIDKEMLYQLYEQHGKNQQEKINQKLLYILDIAVLAPMIGLLGTIVGMYESFSSNESNLRSISPIFLVNGISKALITTIAGISLSIILNFFYRILNNQKRRLFSKLEYFCLLSYQKMKNEFSK